ncbi:glycosyltransferase family 2 protein [Luedemannella flava]
MTQHRPTVTVIVPAYNAVATLDACLTAIRAQTYPVTEVIVVDDRSTDATAELAAGYSATVLRQPVNAGLSAARNAGAAAATGELLCYVDADIALAPDALEQGVAVLAEDPSVGLVHGIYDTEPLVDDGPVERYKTLHNHHWRVRAVGEVRTALFALAVVRRDVLLAAGGSTRRCATARTSRSAAGSPAAAGSSSPTG